jgi:hypothetical protein
MANKEPKGKHLYNVKNPTGERHFCAVCGSELIGSRFKECDRHLLVCPMVDKESLNAEELEHHKKSVMFTASEVY